MECEGAAWNYKEGFPIEEIVLMLSFDKSAASIHSLIGQDVVRRIWERDYTVWKPVQREISDRLGWLSVAAKMRGQVIELKAFAEEVRGAGYQNIVVLGMGGSSLGTLALHRLFGSRQGWPDLHVLDTTVPDAIAGMTDAVDCPTTLFVVASKSGTTIETRMLYQHFRSLVESKMGAANAGDNFIAICDGGTPLERLAFEQDFRRIFTNPADIGGRFSVYSYFGLVPAALMGVDIGALLDEVEAMGSACGIEIPAESSPGALLGATIADHAAKGRDKLTVVTTESLEGFALWVEQLLAESTGKEGRGIIPIVDEPRLSPDVFHDDRLFVYLRLDSDRSEEVDAYVERIEAARIPTIRLSLSDKYAIGAELFRWQFATAVMGHLLGINPFDQPDVQRAKDNTDRLLASRKEAASRRRLASVGSIEELMAKVEPGNYLAITAFSEPTPQFERAIARLRERISQVKRIATTFAYGPRYLHSTGQLHKGGTKSGIFLQFMQNSQTDVVIPGEKFTFGALAAAQAEGDLNALVEQGRPVARVALGSDPVKSVYDLVDCLS